MDSGSLGRWQERLRVADKARIMAKPQGPPESLRETRGEGLLFGGGKEECRGVG